MKFLTDIPLLVKQFLLQARMVLLRARLKARNRIFENVPFSDIEKRYAGRAANLQVESWRTISFERGGVYAFYDIVEGVERKKIAVESPQCLFLANAAGVFSGRGIVYNGYYNCTVLETVESWGNDTNFSTEYVNISKVPSRTLAGLSFSLLSLGSAGNYAHFIFDSVSKLVLLRKQDLTPEWFLVPGPKTAWKEKILNYLRLTDNIVWVDEKDELWCEQLVFTNRINSSRHVTPFAARAVRAIFLPGSQNVETARGKRIIYASRKSASVRKTPLEDILQKVLPDFVEVVDFEYLSMKETIALCQDCRVFLGIHGAGFSNVVFCKPETRIVELRIEEILHEHNRNYYQTLSDYLGCEHLILNVTETVSEEALRKLLAGALEYHSVLS